MDSSTESKKESYEDCFQCEKKNGEKVGICLECKKKGIHKEVPMKDGNTSGLKAHLKNHHIDIHRRLFDSGPQKKCVQQNHQSTLKDFFLTVSNYFVIIRYFSRNNFSQYFLLG